MTTGKQPRPFQRRVHKLLTEGKNVILQAPTGAGKTDAALAPYIQNLERQGHSLPYTCLYATPLRVLSTQFHEKYQGRIARLDQRGTDYLRLYKRLNKPSVSIQTGEQPEDPQFESMLTFCTIDQLLASFLGVPYSVGGRRANLNVGAVVGSYLVLDEFHLYPLRDKESCYGARTTTIAMLSLLKSITPFVLMTATLSRSLLEELAKLLNAEVVIVDDPDELQLIAQGRQRFFEVSETSMQPEHILKEHEGCSMVICNTVLRAQQMYWKLKEQIGERDIELVLLHSRLTDEDRASRSANVMRKLGQAPNTGNDDERYGWKDGNYLGKDIIVVATQVVEVGLDISVRTLHTEIAPANSLIQRAGRCARFARQEGRVIVYKLPEDEEGKPVSTLPYENHLCNATFQALQQLDLQQPVGFLEEQRLINAVHTKEDTDLLERYKKRQSIIMEDIFRSLKENTSSVSSTLIRDIVQVRILIHDDPSAAIQVAPWRWQSFAMHPASLATYLKQFEEQRDSLQLDWVCMEAIAKKEVNSALPDGVKEDIDNRQQTQYEWVPIPYSGNQQVLERRLREAIMIVLPNALAAYHPELGFLLRDERLPVDWTDYQSTLLPHERKREKPKPIQQRSYQGHIAGLVNAYNTSIAQHTVYVVNKLETLLRLPKGSIDQAIRLAIACHDLGKLSIQWQQWALEWQQLLYERQQWSSYQQRPNFFFAKTDFDSNSSDHRKWQRDTKAKRPNHACESVILGRGLIADSLGVTSPQSSCLPLVYAVNAAIARHHTPDGHQYTPCQLKPGALDAIQDALNLARQNYTWVYKLEKIRTTPIEGSDLVPINARPQITLPERGQLHELETWLYFVIVRALRLADQRADDFGDK